MIGNFLYNQIEIFITRKVNLMIVFNWLGLQAKMTVNYEIIVVIPKNKHLSSLW
jgi:hypothetical protein